MPTSFYAFTGKDVGGTTIEDIWANIQQIAESARDAAVAARVGAETARTDCEALEASAKSHASNASSYASAAAQSESNAALSSANIATHEQNASTFADNSASSASAAATSEANALASANNAASSASSASTSESNAANSATAAATSEANASASASASASSAASASASADVATTKATDASNSAAAAASSATDSLNSANAAAQSETNAAASAASAATSEGNAHTYATNAADAASTLNGNIIPVGTIHWFAVDTPPDGWLICDGSAVTSVYPDLRSLLVNAGSPFGTDANSDPLLPDLRGEFIRGFDSGRGVDTGRAFGSWQADDFKAHKHRVQSTDGSSASRLDQGATGFAGWRNGSVGFTGGVAAELVENTGGSETRPRNIALLPCIKAFGSVVVSGIADLAAVTSNFVSLGSVQTITGEKTFDNRVVCSYQTVTASANVALDLSTSNRFEITLDQNVVMDNPVNIAGAGQALMIVLRQDATGGRSAAWGSYWKFPGATAPTLTADPNAIDIVVAEVVSPTEIVCNAITKFG